MIRKNCSFDWDVFVESIELKIPIPEWAVGTRFEPLIEMDSWIRAKQYSHIKLPFSKEEVSGKFVKMWERSPSIRLNLPKLGATVSSRKLFAGKHKPQLNHDDEKVTDAIEWLGHASKIDWHFLDAAKNGQQGSAAITLSLVEPTDGNDQTELIPVLSVWPGKDCTPRLDDADRLTELQVAYTIKGYEWLGLRNGVVNDWQNEPIDPKGDYWFVRRWSKEDIVTLKPMLEGDWNPVDAQWDDVMQGHERVVPELTNVHKLGLLPAIWIRNLPNGCANDGIATFDGALSNCVHLDYTLSQLGRGINYMGSPQLMVKGRILNYERQQGGVHVFGPAHMLNLPADRSEPGGAGQSGADAKLIEMSGAGIQVGMEQWVEKVKHWTLEAVQLSRKDPNTLNGQMSGRAMEMLDEDFIDLVQVLRCTYGEYAYQDIFKLMLKLLVMKKHPKVAGLTDKMIDEIKLEWPRLYAPDPQEVLFLTQAIQAAITAGLMDNVQGADWLGTQIDTKFEPVDMPSPAEQQQQQMEHEVKLKQVASAAKPASKPKGN